MPVKLFPIPAYRETVNMQLIARKDDGEETFYSPDQDMYHRFDGQHNHMWRIYADTVPTMMDEQARRRKQGVDNFRPENRAIISHFKKLRGI